MPSRKEYDNEKDNELLGDGGRRVGGRFVITAADAP